MLPLFDFIEYMCEKYSIDESHGLKHAKGTFQKALDILETMEDVTDSETKVALYSAALHDTCDSKYTNVDLASGQILNWLLDCGWIEEEANAIIAIITSMSYSKLKASSKGGPPIYPDHGKWQRAYHVARHADLLEGYIVARCFLYNVKLYPAKTEDEHWEYVRDIFDNRVLSYVKDGWISIPGALTMVPALESEARRCLEKKDLTWD
jgi:HD superfamily phosphodiesterase